VGGGGQISLPGCRGNHKHRGEEKGGSSLPVPETFIASGFGKVCKGKRKGCSGGEKKSLDRSSGKRKRIVKGTKLTHGKGCRTLLVFASHSAARKKGLLLKKKSVEGETRTFPSWGKAELPEGTRFSPLPALENRLKQSLWEGEIISTYLKGGEISRRGITTKCRRGGPLTVGRHPREKGKEEREKTGGAS